ncbi:MAG: penicillin-binding transpeptidase domain-containing protein, partial [Candidatus Woesearchaeota archaeon]
LELTGGYSAFFNGGTKVEPFAILKVEDSNGKVLEETKPKKGKEVLDPQEAYLISNILSDNSARADTFGTNSLLNIPGRQVAVKTGTTNDKRDNWTIGGTPQRAIGVWVGNNDNSPMLNVASGVSGSSPIWRRITMESLKDLDPVNFVEPDGITKIEVDSFSGKRAHDGFPSRTEIFIKGNEPNDDDIHVKLAICNKEFYIIKEEDPVSTDGKNRWQEAILNWISGQGDSRYKSPSDDCGKTKPINVEIVSPTDQTSNLPNKFDIKMIAETTSKIVEVVLEIDGVKRRTFDGPPYVYEADLADGVHILKATAKDTGGNESAHPLTVGVNSAWDATP